MKIVRVSNFSKRTVSDELIARDVAKYYVGAIVDSLNKKYSYGRVLGDYTPDFFKAVKDDYVLHVFKP